MNVQRSSAIADNLVSVAIVGHLVARGLAGAGVWGDEKRMTSAAVGGFKAFKGRGGRGSQGTRGLACEFSMGHVWIADH